jgi:hypothetical protein
MVGVTNGRYIQNRFHANPGYDQLRANVEAIQQYITEGGQMDVSRVKKIDRKLKKCLNPEFIPGTEEYLSPHPLHWRHHGGCVWR